MVAVDRRTAGAMLTGNNWQFWKSLPILPIFANSVKLTSPLDVMNLRLGRVNRAFKKLAINET